MSFIFPRGGLWWLPPAFEYEVSDYRITSLLKKATKLHLERPFDITEKKIKYNPVLLSRDARYNQADLSIQEMMYMYRDPIAANMIEAIRKDCEEL